MPSFGVERSTLCDKKNLKIYMWKKIKRSFIRREIDLYEVCAYYFFSPTLFYDATTKMKHFSTSDTSMQHGINLRQHDDVRLPK